MNQHHVLDCDVMPWDEDAFMFVFFFKKQVCASCFGTLVFFFFNCLNFETLANIYKVAFISSSYANSMSGGTINGLTISH